MSSDIVQDDSEIDAGARPPAASGAWRRRPSWATLTFAVGIAATVGFDVVQARRLWFFGDDWEFMLHRGLTGHPDYGLFYPHNEHWSTLPILVFRSLYAVFGARRYMPYALTVIGVHVLVTLLLWGLLRRSGVRPWIDSAVGVVVAVMGAGAENTLWDFQISFVGSVAFGLLALLLMPATKSIRPGDGMVALSVLASLMCSGQGLVMLTTVVVYAILARGLLPAALQGALGVGAYLVWYAAIGHVGFHSGGLTASTLGHAPTYVWFGLEHVWEAMSGIPGGGLLILASAVVVLVRTEAEGRTGVVALPAAGLAGAVVLYFLTALTRAETPGQASASRYAYVGAVLTTPAVALALQRLYSRVAVPGLAARGIGLLAVLFLVASGLQQTYLFRVSRQQLLKGIPQQVIGGAQLVASGQPLLGSLVEPTLDPDVTVVALRKAIRDRTLPSYGLNSKGVLDAADFLQVAIGPRPRRLTAPSKIEVVGATLSAPDGNGCRSATNVPFAYLLLTVGAQPVEVRLTSHQARLSTYVLRNGQLSQGRNWNLPPAQDAYVAASAPGSALRVVLPARGAFNICPA